MSDSLSLTERSLRFIPKIAAELGLAAPDVAATARLLAEGATVPFIARYRKEATGTMDEVGVTAVRDRMLQLVELETRREAVTKSLDERKLLTPELRKAVEAAETMTRLEDVFAPYRPKRRTRATIAQEKGLEPLADFLLANMTTTLDPLVEAGNFVVQSEDKDKAVATPEEALAGARDILAERFSDDAGARAAVRKLMHDEGTVTSKVLPGKENEGDAAKFKDYFEWSEPLGKIPSHRLLAIRRGEKEGFLMMRITIPEEKARLAMRAIFVKGATPCALQIEQAVGDGYKRLLALSIETEARMESKKTADREAVRVFAENLEQLLLASPLGQKRVLAIDPGFRTGCKTVVLDAQGALVYDDVLYVTGSASQMAEAKMKILKLVEHFKIEAIAIGNGTASRETETFVKAIGLPKSIQIVLVNESGASIYSASEVAREEFPDKDLTVRGSVSIGRRLMDPLAELVKLDPKSIGVGQYQHDVDQTLLKSALDDTVISCVNRVGVEVNTASKQLLSYVSGLNSTIAENIVKHRNENGPFLSRSQLTAVPRLGDKTFEQAAGFLRIREGVNPLDSSAVHPESYEVVGRMAADLGKTVGDLMRDPALRQRVPLQKYVTGTIGLPTLKDIMEELAKPGRDPREQFEGFSFSDGVEKPTDLKPGMKMPGIVTNVTAFGAFVDIGVHQDGLVHISQLSDQFVKNPADVVKVAQRVMVTVIEIDLPRNRIALSMKSKPDMEPRGTGDRKTSPGGSGRDRERFAAVPAKSGGSGGGGGGGFGGNWFDQASGKR